MDLKELAAVDPDRHWYYQAKLFALRRELRRHRASARHIVDVGAGSGFFSTRLADVPQGATVVCVDPNYDADSEQQDGRVRFVRSATDVDVRAADVLLFIDVLEHVADDLALLRSFTDRAAPGTLVLITVPAFMSLWSAHDVFLEHHRRYRLGEVTDVVRRARLDVVAGRYLFGTVFPLAWAVRRARRGRAAASDLKPAPALLDRLLTAVLKAEHRIPANRVAGLSAFVVARVPQR